MTETLQTTTTVVVDDFFTVNKKPTHAMRDAIVRALGSGDTLPQITRMQFGTGGAVDDSGNPLPPTDTGGLNNAVLTVPISVVEYIGKGAVRLTGRIEPDTLYDNINEAALLSSDGTAFAKYRMLTAKGMDAETGIIFEWTLEFA